MKAEVAVADLPFIDSRSELKSMNGFRLGLYTPSGKTNDYRVERMLGRGGSRSDPAFDPTIGKRGGHRCCGSRVWWRHKVACPLLQFSE